MEEVSNGYQEASEAVARNAESASYFNNFIGDLLGFDSTYSSREQYLAARMQNEFNSAEAIKSRNWQEYMSNTANQRAVKDLEAAGFSPLALLSNASSASSPGGATASSGGSFGGSGSKSGDIMKSLMSTMLMLGMSSANMMTKMNIAAATNGTRLKISNDRLAALAKK